MPLAEIEVASYFNQPSGFLRDAPKLDPRGHRDVELPARVVPSASFSIESQHAVSQVATRGVGFSGQIRDRPQRRILAAERN